ncbi:hypothetical protein IscW_ISCW007324 [Ixodes scapularis]|uniref:Uncharacterized protein n=1 Tax=Ixodes scapularis TaxID=6945 RepID=B7PUB4_IXOSC|nr:hypothetical protein IscW_ISCW007324 [Ixodes scapularis]|eukprot:XP_002405876.1 hypothetical protein IscW_ISCW007324 [Ixodes scapularis]
MPPQDYLKGALFTVGTSPPLLSSATAYRCFFPLLVTDAVLAAATSLVAGGESRSRRLEDGKSHRAISSSCPQADSPRCGLDQPTLRSNKRKLSPNTDHFLDHYIFFFHF